MQENKFRVLVLDGGGSKGVYTLGILKELELKLGGKLHQHFELIYGTSTGSIIASLIALGYDIKSIEKLYFKLIPKIMQGFSKADKSFNLKTEADKVFKKKKFDSFKTDIGIVSLNYDLQQPLIFKSNIKQAHAMKQSFEAGFGCTISEAVQCSSSAFPIFDMKKIELSNQGSKNLVNAIDGGFIANDATLYALIDAHKAFNKDISEIRLLSIGVGKFIEKSMGIKYWLFRQVRMVKFVERILNANTNTNILVAKLLFPNLKMVRVCDEYTEPEYETNMIETDENKLKKLNQLGRGSYAKYEKDIVDLLFN